MTNAAAQQAVSLGRKSVLQGNGSLTVTRAVHNAADEWYFFGQGFEPGYGRDIVGSPVGKPESSAVTIDAASGEAVSLPTYFEGGLTSLVYDSTAEEIYGSRNNGLFRMDTGAGTWLRIEIPPDKGLGASGSFQLGGGVIYVRQRLASNDINEGIWQYSRDGGRTWRPRAAGFSWAIDPFDGCRLLQASPSRTSVDCGETWQPQSDFPAGTNLGTFADSVHRSVLYAIVSPNGGSTGELWKSKDWGANWRKLAEGLVPGGTVFGDPFSAAGVFVTVPNQGLLYSPDEGANWRVAISTDRFGLDRGFGGYQVDPKTGAVYFVVVPRSSPFQPVQLWSTSDGFRTLRHVYTGPFEPTSWTPWSNGRVLISRDVTPVPFIAKATPAGEPLWLNYLGGLTPGPNGGASFSAGDIAIAPNGDIFVTAAVDSPDSFPFTHRLTETAANVLLRISHDGEQILSATRVPVAGALALARDGSIYLAGPSRRGVTNPTGSLVKLDSTGTRILFQTETVDRPMQVFEAPDSSVYFSHLELGSGRIRKLTPEGRTLWQRRVGAANLRNFQVLPDGDILAAGSNGNATLFLVTPGAFQPQPPPFFGVPGIERDGYLVRFSPEGEVKAATLFGGNQYDWITAVTASQDGSGAVIATGLTTSSVLFPTRNLLSLRRDNPNGFLLRLDGGMRELHYSTYLERFEPVGIFPQPDGSYVLAGSGWPDPDQPGADGIVLLRIAEAPETSPRIDGINPAPTDPENVVTGAGFTPSSVITVGGQPIPTRFVNTGELRFPFGVVPLRGRQPLVVEDGERRSQTVWWLIR